MLAGLTACSETIVLGSECPDELNVCAQHDDAGAPPVRNRDAMAEDAEVDSPDAPALECVAGSDEPACSCEAEALHSVLGHWPLDEGEGRSAVDVTSQAPSGSLLSFVGDGAWQQGKLAGALQFDGLDDRVQIGALAAPIKTISLWLAPDGTHVRSDRTALQPPSSHGPVDQWSDPQNAYADDNQVASTSSLIGLRDQHWGGFHLAEQLPRDAQIQGITISVDIGNLGVLGGFRVELSSDAGQTHTDSRYAWGQLIIGSQQRQAGGADKLWGHMWSPSDFEAERFRVLGSFGGIANAMALDYLAVQVAYAPHDTPRTILALGPDSVLTFGKGQTVGSLGDADVYVNGERNGTLADGWNHVALVSASGLSASDLQLGMAAPAQQLRYAYKGRMDDVRLFAQPLTPFQLGQLQALHCEP